MFAKRAKQSSPAAASVGRRQPNRTVRTRPARRSHRTARARARRADARSPRALREQLDAATFKVEVLEKSYAKQLADTRDKLAAIEAELQEKNEILANLGGGHEHTLRELNDALTVIKVLKTERDKLRKQIAQGGFRQPSETARRERCSPTVTGDAGRRAAARSTRSSPTPVGPRRKSRSAGSGHASAQVAAQDTPHEEMLAPDLVFTGKDKRKRRRALALVPLHERRTRLLAFVVPLKAERLLAQDRRLEAAPRLDLEVVERAAVRAQAVRNAGREIDERAGLDLLRAVRRPRPCRGL